MHELLQLLLIIITAIFKIINIYYLYLNLRSKSSVYPNRNGRNSALINMVAALSHIMEFLTRMYQNFIPYSLRVHK